MSLLILNFDVLNKRLVRSISNSGLFQIPDIHQEDQISIQLNTLQQISYLSAPFFSAFNIANFALQISIGTAGVVNASQNLWTKNTDNTQFFGTLNLNTAGINALADGVQRIFEIRLTSATEAYHFQQYVTYHKIVAATGALAVIPDDRGLGAIEASEIYMPYELPAGRGYTLVSADGTKKILHYLDNDGTERAVNLT